MYNIVVRMTDFLVAQQAIDKKDTAIYRYGMEVMFLTVIEVASILMIAVVVGNGLETLLYFLAFIPLRLFAGGYHATTRLRCYMLSLAVYGAFSACLIVVPERLLSILSIGAAALSLVMVLSWAPVIHRNRLIDDESIKKYKKISCSIAMMETVLIFIGSLFFQSIRIFAFSLGFFAEACSILATKR